MSSFVVGSDHIDFMVTAVDVYLTRAQRYTVTYGSPSRTIDLRSMTDREIGLLMWEANVDGVEAEYGGTIEPDTRKMVDAYKHRRWMGVPALSAVNVLKACQFLEYQSGDAPAWEDSAPCMLLDMLRNAAITKLPGYDDAPWGVTRG